MPKWSSKRCHSWIRSGAELEVTKRSDGASAVRVLSLLLSNMLIVVGLPAAMVARYCLMCSKKWLRENLRPRISVAPQASGASALRTCAEHQLKERES